MMLQNLKPVIYLFFIYNVLEVILLFITPISTKEKTFFSDLAVVILFLVLAVISSADRSIYSVICIFSLVITAKTVGYSIYEKRSIFSSKSRFTFFISALISVGILVYLFIYN